jgi:hypothetical protein
MNRRSFLKSLTAACGAAVICPGELLKDKPEPITYIGRRIKLPWKHYYITYRFKANQKDKELLRKFRKAFKNTKFHPPIFIQGIPVFKKNQYETTQT